MTVTLRGTTTAASGIGVAAATGVTVTKPTGVVSGDLLVAMWWGHSGATFTPPTGWTTALQTTINEAEVLVSWLIAGGSEPSSYTFKQSVDDDISVQVQAFQGGTFNTTTPIALATATSFNSATYTAPSITTTINGSVFVCVYANQDNESGVATAPSGLTQLALTLVSDGEQQASYYGVQATAGATGTHALVWNTTGQGGAYTFAVQAPAAVPASVTVSPTSATITPDSPTVTLTPTVKDSGSNVISGAPCTYASSNTGVATVNSSGVVTWVAAGSATITVTATGGSSPTATCAITCSAAAAATTVTVTPSSQTINGPSGTLSLSAVVDDQYGSVMSGASVAWSSSNTAVATVNASTGLVTYVGPGTCTITATSGSATGTCAITCVLPTYTWASSNPAVASVDGNGVVTKHAAGSCTITCTRTGTSATGSVAVVLT